MVARQTFDVWNRRVDAIAFFFSTPRLTLSVPCPVPRFGCSCSCPPRWQLGAWMLFALVLSRLRYFYGVMLGTFVMSYMGNTVIEVSMRKGNQWLQRWVCVDGCLEGGGGGGMKPLIGMVP